MQKVKFRFCWHVTIPTSYYGYIANLALCARTRCSGPSVSIRSGQVFWSQMDWEPAGCTGRDSPRLSSGMSSCWCLLVRTGPHVSPTIPSAPPPAIHGSTNSESARWLSPDCWMAYQMRQSPSAIWWRLYQSCAKIWQGGFPTLEPTHRRPHHSWKTVGMAWYWEGDSRLDP